MKTNNIWALRTDDMEAVKALYEYRPKMTGADLKAINDSISERNKLALSGFNTPGNIAVIPIKNLLTCDFTFETWIFNGTAYCDIHELFSKAASDNSISRIILDIDSPGGEMNGLLELMEEIREARNNKEIIAYIRNLGASAAYGIASQATRIIASETAEVGSVGVMACFSEYKPEGYQEKILVAKQSPKKYADPFTPGGEAQLQPRIDWAAEKFIEKISLGRGMSSNDIINKFGKGDVLNPNAALSAGMIDQIGNFKSALTWQKEIIPEQTGQTAKATAKGGTKLMSKIFAKLNASKLSAKLVVVDDEQVDVSNGKPVEEIDETWIETNLPDVYKSIQEKGVNGEKEKQEEIDKEITPADGEEMAIVKRMRHEANSSVAKIAMAILKHRDTKMLGLRTDRAQDAQVIPAVQTASGTDVKPDETGKQMGLAGKALRGLK